VHVLLDALRDDLEYELRVSHLATSPAAFDVVLERGCEGGAPATGRRLLNTAQTRFRVDGIPTGTSKCATAVITARRDSVPARGVSPDDDVAAVVMLDPSVAPWLPLPASVLSLWPGVVAMIAALWCAWPRVVSRMERIAASGDDARVDVKQL
jgi:hypothetical protein